MKIKKATIFDMDEITEIQRQMFSAEPRWTSLWNNGVDEKIAEMWRSYFSGFSDGFLVGGETRTTSFILVTRISEIKKIPPYIHDCRKYYKPDGKIAYTPCFAVEKSKTAKTEGVVLYKKAEELAKKWGCTKLVTLTGVSRLFELEREIIKEAGFKLIEKGMLWELFQNINVQMDVWAIEL